MKKNPYMIWPLRKLKFLVQLRMEACSSVEDEFAKNLLNILLQFALFTAGKTLPKQRNIHYLKIN